MKKLILILSLLLLILAVPVMACRNGNCERGVGSVSNTVTVAWEIEGCWIALCVVPDFIYLGRTSPFFNPGDVLVDDDNNRISVITNCHTNIQLIADVQTTAYPPGFPGGKSALLSDFYVMYQRWHHGSVLVSWTPASNLPVMIDTWSGPGAKHFNAGYKYVLDLNDIPGNYAVTIMYTATAQ
jgi:hypothetical protein